jgi:hypothetical protein
MYIDKFRNEETNSWVTDDNTHLGYLDDTDERDVIVTFYFDCDVGGQSDSFITYIFQYLKMIDEQKWPKEYDGLFYAIMNLLDKCNLIESGVSIRVPWLTERGKNCLNDIKEFMEA